MNQLLKIDDMNESTFLNEAAEGYKDPISTADCSQNSSMVGYIRQTAE